MEKLDLAKVVAKKHEALTHVESGDLEGAIRALVGAFDELKSAVERKEWREQVGGR